MSGFGVGGGAHYIRIMIHFLLAREYQCGSRGALVED
jgi:hypothetical protein